MLSPRGSTKTWVTALLVCAPAPAVAESDDATRSFYVGASYVVRAPNDLEGTGEHGGGVWSSYEFHVSERSRVGVNLALRRYPEGDALTQVGYGLLLKHYLVDARSIRCYAQYGLLLQQSWHSGRDGSATSHDTLLSVGMEGGAGAVENWFLHLGYDFSWLRFFDTETKRLSYAQIAIGRAFDW